MLYMNFKIRYTVISGFIQIINKKDLSERHLIK